MALAAAVAVVGTAARPLSVASSGRPQSARRPAPSARLQQSSGSFTPSLRLPLQRRRQQQEKRSCRAVAAGEPQPGLTSELKEALDDFIAKNKVVLFMKGTREFPQCGFSNTCVQILNIMGAPYETVNILEDETLRQGMKMYSSWPTFPQVYIDGEFIGGCDILIESYQSGELKEMLERATVS
eukprot:jgi/Chlat1/1422/Chrsp12S01982